MVVLDFCGTWALTSEGNIRSQVFDDMVRENISCTPFFKKYTLIVVLLNTVSHGELLVDHLFSHMFFKDYCRIDYIIKCREPIISSSDSVFEELCVEACMIFKVKMAHFGVEVSQLLTTDVSTRVVRKLNSCLSICLDDVCFYLWPAFQALTDNAVVSWGLDVIFLDCRLTRGVWIITEDKNSVISALLNCIFKNDGVIIDNLNGTVINLHLIHAYKSINSRIDYNWWAFANHKYIM